MEERTVWIVDPNPAFRCEAEKSLREAEIKATGLGEISPPFPWREEDVLIIAAELLPIKEPPAMVIALVPPGDGPAQVKALESEAHWCIPRDQATLPHLSAILTALQAHSERLAPLRLYENALERIEESVVIEDAEGHFTLVSSRAAEMLGYRPDDLLGQHWTEIVHPDDRELVAAETAKRAHGIASQYEARLLHRDGSSFPVWITATPLSEKGHFTSVLVAFRDVSREKNLRKRFHALQQIAVGLGKAQDLPAIFRRTRDVLYVLIEGVRDIIFAIADEEGEILRPLILERDNHLLNLLTKILGTPPSKMRFPLSTLPADWHERIPKGRPCVSLDVVQVGQQVLGPQAVQMGRQEYQVQSVVGLPLRSGGLLRGMIVLTLDQEHIHQEDLDLGMAVANLVASALESRSLLEQARRRMYSLDRLFELAQAMAASAEPTELATTAARQFIQALNVEKASIVLRDQETDILRVIVDLSYDYEEDAFKPPPSTEIYALEDSAATRRVLNSRQPLQVLLSDPGGEPQTLAYMREEGVRMLVILPLVHKGKCIGTVRLEDSTKERRLTPDQMSLAMTLAGQMAAALENTRLFSEVQRRAIQLQTAAEVAQHATAILDIDALLAQTVELIRERFDLYYTGIFLVDESGQWAILRAGTGEAGRRMLETGHKLEVGGPSMIGWCVAHGEARIALDVGKEATRFDNPLLPETHSEMALPLVSRGRVIGAMTVQSTEPVAFSQEDVIVIQTMADQLANAIENARLYRAAHLRAERLAVVNRIARAASATLDLNDLVETVYQEVVSNFEADAFFLALYDQKTDELDFRFMIDEGVREPRRQEPVGSGLTGLVVTEKKPLLISNLKEEIGHLPRPARQWGSMKVPASWLGVPMRIGDQVVGVICVQAYRPYAYGEEERLLLLTIADQVAVAVENARLYEQERRRATQASLLNVVAQRTNAILSPERLLPAVAEAIHQHFDYDSVALLLVVPDAGELIVAGKAGVGTDVFPDDYRQPLSEGIIGWVATHGEPLLTNNTSQEERYIAASPDRYRAGSELAVPLKIGGETVGVLDLQCLQCDGFDELDVTTAQTMAEQVAVALQNARLYMETRQRADELAALNAVAARLGQSLELREVLEAAMEDVTRVLGVEASAISLVNEETEELILHAQRGLRYQHLDMRIPLGEGLSGQVVRTGEVLITGDVSKDPRLAVPDFAQEQIQAMVLVPMYSRGKVVGVLSAMSHAPHEFSEREILLLRAIANQVGTAAENARLFEAERSQRQTAETMRSVAAVLTSSLEIGQVLGWLLDHLGRLVPHDRATVMLLEDGQLRVAAAHGYDRLPNGREVAGHTVALVEDRLLRQVVQGKDVVLIPDTTADPRWWYEAPQWRTSSWIGVPLTVRDTVIGMLSVARETPQPFGEGEATLVADIASHAAIAIENARLYDAARRQARELAAMYRIATTVSRSLELPAVLSEALAHVTELAGLQAGAILLRERNSRWMTLAAHRRLPEGALERLQTVTLGEGALGKAVERTEASRFPVWEIFCPKARDRHGGSSSGVVVPLRMHGRVIGAMALGADRPTEAPSATIRLLDTIARNLAVAIENARLHTETETREQMARALYQVTRQLTSLEPRQIPERVLTELQQVVAYNVAGVLIRWDSDVDLMLHVTSPCSQEELQEAERRLLEGFRLLGGGALEVENIHRSVWTQVEITPTSTDKPLLESHLSAPLVVGERLAGILQLSSRQPQAYDEQAQRLLLTVANQVATAVENAQLYQEVKKHAANLERAYARLQEVDQLKDELIQNVSHELRTPLTFVKGYVQLLLDEELGPLTESQRKSLDVVARKTDHLARLVTDIVTLETVSRETLDIKPIDLGQLARMALEGCRPAASKASIVLQEDIPAGPSYALADWSRISEVFDNLLVNAIKFSPDGGTITVRVKEEGDWLRVEVSDTGIGIPTDKIHRIFDRFYQVDGSPRRRFGGAGLGLAIVKRIIESHNGQVGAESEPGEGSTFYFTLPKAAP